LKLRSGVSGVAEVVRMSVAADKRRKGIGRMILRDLLGTAESLFLSVRHNGKQVLIVRLPAPPSAPTDVLDTKPGLLMNVPYERLFERNGSFWSGRVMQSAQPGCVLRTKRHEAAAPVDSGTGLVIEQEIARHTDTVRREQPGDLVQVVFDGVWQHVRENGRQEDEIEALVRERKAVRGSGH
jgi:hypothetical protein